MRSVNQLEPIRKSVEKLSKFHQIEVLKILMDHKIELNENNYGTFINMSELDGGIIDKIINYMEYVDEQELQLKNVEREKGDLKNKFFKANSYHNEEELISMET